MVYSNEGYLEIGYIQNVSYCLHRNDIIQIISFYDTQMK